MKKMLMWYYMFTKRLFKRWSFIVILLIIPILIPIAQLAMGDDASIMNIALYAKDENNENVQKAMEQLVADESVIRYKIYKSQDEAQEAVRTQKVDAAWIFEKDFEQKAEKVGRGRSKKPLVTVVQREENISMKLSREKLYGAMYPFISYGVLKGYVNEELLPDKNLTDEELRKYFEDTYGYDSIITMQKLDSDEELKSVNTFLSMPLRGLLALVIMLCGIAAAMYFLTDKADGKFDWMPPRKRIVPAFGSCLAAVTASSVAVMIAVIFAGMFTNVWNEIPAIILYIIAATGFSLVLCMLFNSAGKLGALIPFFMIVMLVLCPIFFGGVFLQPVKLLLPPYYYLYGLYDFDYLIQMIFYSIIVYAVAIILNIVLSTRKNRL